MKTPEQEQILDLIHYTLNTGPLSIHTIKLFKTKEDLRLFQKQYQKWLEDNIYPQLDKLERTL